MPYNNTAIPPSEQVTGTTALPLTRVKRILQADDEILSVSNQAAFVITAATELFIRYAAEQSHNVAKTESKPRRNVQYRDVANAVARIDNLEFLIDVVPRTMSYREFKAKKALKGAARTMRALQTGQTTLDSNLPRPNRTTEQPSPNNTESDQRNFSLEESSQGPDTVPPLSGTSRTNGDLVFQHYEPNGHARREESSDVEML